ncbi:Protein CBG26878 [Caenorhabditis briggsae]|uniref:Protein CBG26878 n=1 Tax=Caenorhabditis briggsae TaxID=6238 RepID=B6II78_CAEBR|nr:Protein CBG26878 [Caenorhabditis briggsae]CAR99608.1 Protein CBG26878 [Caenorhabditis briggsae]
MSVKKNKRRWKGKF